mmetsp:Transcript_38697/g.90506  ORF Transcript_38697/g.90506 Transcript_38697/m.90506 type:complete len:333 (+) Transcript_38697:1652-2650(+)
MDVGQADLGVGLRMAVVAQPGQQARRDGELSVVHFRQLVQALGVDRPPVEAEAEEHLVGLLAPARQLGGGDGLHASPAERRAQHQCAQGLSTTEDAPDKAAERQRQRQSARQMSKDADRRKECRCQQPGRCSVGLVGRAPGHLVLADQHAQACGGDSGIAKVARSRPVTKRGSRIKPTVVTPPKSLDVVGGRFASAWTSMRRSPSARIASAGCRPRRSSSASGTKMPVATVQAAAMCASPFSVVTMEPSASRTAGLSRIGAFSAIGATAAASPAGGTVAGASGCGDTLAEASGSATSSNDSWPRGNGGGGGPAVAAIGLVGSRFDASVPASG